MHLICLTQYNQEHLYLLMLRYQYVLISCTSRDARCVEQLRAPECRRPEKDEHRTDGPRDHWQNGNHESPARWNHKTSNMHTGTSSTLKAQSFKSDNAATNVCLVQRSCKLYHNILDYLQRLFWLEYLFKTIVKQSRSQSNNIKHKHVIFRRHLRTSNTITWRFLTCK